MDVVGVHREVLAGPVLLDEGPDLGVLVDHLLHAHLRGEGAPHGLEGLLVRAAVLGQLLEQLPPGDVQVVLRLLGQAVVGELGGVGDEGEHRLVQRAADLAEHRKQRLQQQAAELLALAVDVGVVAAREVDALEGALLEGQRLQDLLHGPGAAPLHAQRLAGRDVLHQLLADVEDRLDQRRLAGDDDHVLVRVVRGRADAAGVAQHEGVAVAEHARDAVAAVPVAGGAAQDARDVQVLRDETEAGLRVVARGRVLDVEVIVLLVDEVPHLLQQHDGVGDLARVLAELHQAREEVLVVRDVEVPREDQVPRHPVALTRDGVAPVDAVLAVCAVAHVREQSLAAERDVLAHPLRVGLVHVVAGLLRRPLQPLGGLLLHASEEVLDGVGGDGLLAVDVLRAWGHIKGHAGHARAVLAAVALLLHEHVHAVEAEEVRAVLLHVVLRRLEKPHQRETALVADVVTHGVKEAARYNRR
mmetsp:Transcript_82619/g.212836  ORF Transcript_82619/g.212836 Transcript_82619/m.212836 type:complete len:472 (+) Transcript_82619:3604-5019(+)